MFRIPSVQTLRVLEACHRLNSFTRAADELGISQGAVSQQIKTLEQRLGFAVFLREGRRIAPTPAGEALVAAVHQGFGHIAEVIAQQKRRQREDQLVISVLPGFAIRWLFPRLMSFEQAHPELTLTVNAISDPLDFSLHHGHAAITYGPVEEAPAADWLFREQIFPVCSPAFALQHGLDQPPVSHQLGTLPRLIDSSPTARPYSDSWACWAAQRGIELSDNSERRHSQSNMTLQLAELGHGIAMGRSSLVMDAMLEGKLIRLDPQPVANPCSYRLIANPAIPEGPALSAFRQWLQQQTADIRSFIAQQNTSPAGDETDNAVAPLAGHGQMD